MRVSGMDDERWPVALDLLLSGQGTIQVGELLTIRWWTRGVGAADSVKIEIHSNGDPRFIPRDRREREIAEGLETLDRVAAAFPALGDLIREQAVDRGYVHKLGKGSVEIARIGADGTIAWNPELRWVEHGST